MATKKTDSKAVEDAFDYVCIDINGFTAKDWDAIQRVARELVHEKAFGGDAFKCSIAAFVLWVDEGNGAHEVAPDGTLFN